MADGGGRDMLDGSDSTNGVELVGAIETIAGPLADAIVTHIRGSCSENHSYCPDRRIPIAICHCLVACD